MTRFTLSGGRVFTGDEFVDANVIVDGATIVSVGPDSEGPVTDVNGAILAPGYIDLMVNGGGGILFNEAPERVNEIVAAHRRLGTTSMLLNFITDTVERMAIGRSAVEHATNPGALGIHFEGPLLSKERPGMHAPEHIATDFPVELAARSDKVVTVVTLAPEEASALLIASLVEVGAKVSMGHSNATLDQFRSGVAAGATLITHMFNALRPFQGRDPGIVGGGLTDDNVYIDVINDGVHTDFTSIRLAWKAKPAGKCFYVTDAMPPVGSDATEFTAVGLRVRVQDGRLVTDLGGIGGSLLTMAKAVQNGVEHVGIPVEESLKMASTYPAIYLGVDDKLGRIVPGHTANMVMLDDDLSVQRVMCEGAWLDN